MPVLFFIAVNLRPNNFARYIVPAIPFLCMTAAIALRTIVGTLLSPTLMAVRAYTLDHPRPLLRTLTAGRVLRVLGPAALTAGALIVATPSWLDVIRYDGYTLGPDTRNAAQSWFEQAVPAGARVLVEGGESFERTSNLGPQLWPTPAQLAAWGPNEERERFFWRQLGAAVSAAPSYSLTLVPAFERRNEEVGTTRLAVAVQSVAEYGWPDYVVLLSWRSDDLRPGSPAPLWQSLNSAYSLVQTFGCQPCFPEDYYAWRMDYPTLESIPLAGGAPLIGGPEVRIFQYKTTPFPVRSGAGAGREAAPPRPAP
ncbi:MAG TPA: hypothetical protein VKY74_15125, partial [Chloroflexia bacterium]|nr:hypothetical protein [Chloroflexia bacterium]